MDEIDSYYIKQLENKITELQRGQKLQQEMISDLREELEDLMSKIEPPKISTEPEGNEGIQRIIKQFGESIELLNDQASEKYAQGKNPMMVSDFSVDLKTTIDIKQAVVENLKEGQVRLAAPSRGAVHASEEVSTIHFSLKPVPRIRRIE